MLKGFYNATSGILTQSRILNSVGTNIANASTPGYKKDVMVNSTFREWLTYRTGNMDKSGTTSIDGDQSMIRTVLELDTDFTQGMVEETDRDFDFCIVGDGFFQIRTPSDEVQYTRNGAFTLDANRDLVLLGVGYVLGEDGQPINIGSDSFTVDEQGNIFADRYTEEGDTLNIERGVLVGRIGLVGFEDNDALRKTGEGMFVPVDEDTNPAAPPAGTQIMWKALELSNISAVDEMSQMMVSQRALQASASVLKMYDSLLGKAVTDIGRV